MRKSFLILPANICLASLLPFLCCASVLAGELPVERPHGIVESLYKKPIAIRPSLVKLKVISGDSFFSEALQSQSQEESSQVSYGLSVSLPLVAGSNSFGVELGLNRLVQNIDYKLKSIDSSNKYRILSSSVARRNTLSTTWFYQLTNYLSFSLLGQYSWLKGTTISFGSTSENELQLYGYTLISTWHHESFHLSLGFTPAITFLSDFIVYRQPEKRQIELLWLGDKNTIKLSAAYILNHQRREVANNGWNVSVYSEYLFFDDWQIGLEGQYKPNSKRANAEAVSLKPLAEQKTGRVYLSIKPYLDAIVMFAFEISRYRVLDENTDFNGRSESVLFEVQKDL